MAIVLLLPGAGRAANSDALVGAGLERCEAGEVRRAVETLRTAYEIADTPAGRIRAAGALGLALYRMQQFDEAEPLLQRAHQGAERPADRAVRANDLGNLYVARGQPNAARRFYLEAGTLAPEDASLQTSVALNLAQLAPAEERLRRLQAVQARLDDVADAGERARYAANLGGQAAELGAAGRRMAYESLALARRLGARLGDVRLQAQALEALARLYRDDERGSEARRLVDEAVRLAQQVDARDLLYRLEWQRGRLLRAAGRLDEALAAYRRAVDHIEAIRLDMPIRYESGRSSLRETLAPLYLELTDLLLAPGGQVAPAADELSMREAREVVERLKRSELEDYLGERCTVASLRLLDRAALPAGTAVLYPVMLPDRLVLLVETGQGLARHEQPVPARELEERALEFARLLRNRLPAGAAARSLFDLLMRPFAARLLKDGIETLVVVPDGALRLVPFGALRDGDRFAVEDLAIVTAPALSLTRTGTRRGDPVRALLAGLSEPGPGLDQLPAWLSGAAGAAAAGSRETLRAALGLPRVKEEIETVGRAVPGEALVDREFTLAAFGQRLESGRFDVVHVASHGVFSGSAGTSFVMAYDGLLTMDALQRLLRSDRLRARPIEVLSLSACQTAEGDDRAPLGIAGAALKARANSALGTLWPASDDAATPLMARFYAALARGLTKAKALQEAQRSLIDEGQFRDPFFWAGFILVGDWQ